jgi:hypothetical protein
MVVTGPCPALELGCRIYILYHLHCDNSDNYQFLLGHPSSLTAAYRLVWAMLKSIASSAILDL